MSTGPEYLEQIMPADEQAEVFRDALLGHHYALMAELGRQLELIRSTPGAMTPEVIEFFGDALAAEERWLASHGLVWPTRAQA